MRGVASGRPRRAGFALCRLWSRPETREAGSAFESPGAAPGQKPHLPVDRVLDAHDFQALPSRGCVSGSLGGLSRVSMCPTAETLAVALSGRGERLAARFNRRSPPGPFRGPHPRARLLCAWVLDS